MSRFDTQIVAAISALVVQILDADQSSEFAVPLAPLTTGRIMLGRQFLKDRTSPSSVVFVPIASSFAAAVTMSQTVKASSGSTFPGATARKLSRPLWTDRAAYEVHCWGQANPADPENDFDATRYLAHTVMQACYLLANTSVELHDGVWEDQGEKSAQLVKAGHRFTFGVTLHLPVTDSSVQPAPTLIPVTTVTVASNS